MLAKRALIRIVRSPEGVRIDPTSKLPGRGAYLHDRIECWERGLGGSLARALRVEITPAERQELVHFMQTLPEAIPGSDNP